MFDSYARATHGGSQGTIPYVVSFTNNHVMDFGRQALDQETFAALSTYV